MNSINQEFAKKVVFLGDLELRLIPGYAYAYAGSDGVIRHIAPTGKIYTPTPREYKTTKGSYLYVSVITDEFTPVIKPVHRLVCLAFHGKPDVTDCNVEPNHIDGDKHNNRPSNLEWLTHRNNVQHAYNTGLTTQGIRIKVHDVISKKTHEFNTLSHCSRVLGVSRFSLRDAIARHRETPYMDRYIFEIDDTLDKKVDRHQKNAVVVKDYVSGTTTIYGSFADASFATGVKAGTLRYRAVNELLGLHSGFVFKLIGASDKGWPSYTTEEVSASLLEVPRVR